MESLIGLRTTYTGTARPVLRGIQLTVTGVVAHAGPSGQPPPLEVPLFERGSGAHARPIEVVTDMRVLSRALTSGDLLEVAVALGSLGQVSCRRWYVPGRELQLSTHLSQQKDHNHDHQKDAA